MSEGIGRLLVWLGGGILLLGLVLILVSRVPGLNRIPGNIVIQRENFTLYVPLGTMIVVSVLLTVLFNLISRLRR